MSNANILGVLELAAILSCAYGLYFLTSTGGLSFNLNSLLAFLYNGLWFIFGCLSNLCGIISLWKIHSLSEEEMSTSNQYYAQYHYLLAWLTIVVGYPSVVTQIWMAHYPTPFAHLHVILSIIPMVAWMNRRAHIIVTTTQIMTFLAILSHFYISYLAHSFWGMVGSGMMFMNVISLSMPTRYNLWGFSSRELYVMGLAITSYIFCLVVAESTERPYVVQDIFPWFK